MHTSVGMCRLGQPLAASSATYALIFTVVFANVIDKNAGLRPDYAHNMYNGTTENHVAVRCKVTSNNAWHLAGYVPSTWETEWFDHKEAWTGKACAMMVNAVWINNLTALEDGQHLLDFGMLKHLSPAVWSYFEYINPCVPDSDPNHKLRVPIEPIVGLMRHPYTPPQCVPPGKPLVSVESRDYLLIHAMSPGMYKHLYPGRAWFFDLGARSYKSSAEWFVDRYAARGVHFDGIFAWEAAGIDHSHYWSEVPARIVPVMHLYNHPVMADVLLPGQPLNVLHQIYRPGDLVVFKLDIDVTDLENIVLQALKHPDMRRMVGEVYFEHHTDVSDMKDNGWGEWDYKETWASSVSLFNELRQAGMRIHYWP